MLVSGIKSRPVYGTLSANDQARLNIVFADGEGALAILAMTPMAPAQFWSCTHIVYVAGGSAPRNHFATLEALGAFSCYLAPTIAAALPRLQALLAAARMGTQLYLAGTEPLIGEGVRVAGQFGIRHQSIRTEHRGSLARRVQCVHCKGMTEPVTTNVYTCSHCGLRLLVRDHYSRRLGAFQGLNVDAEVPGEGPATEEIFK